MLLCLRQILSNQIVPKNVFVGNLVTYIYIYIYIYNIYIYIYIYIRVVAIVMHDLCLIKCQKKNCVLWTYSCNALKQFLEIQIVELG
jgi:hypothetical protein